MNIFLAQLIESNCIKTDESEASHILKTLRKKVNDIVHFTDGKGHLYESRIINDIPKHFSAEIIGEKSLPNFKSLLSIAIAPTKNNDRMEWFIEKAVEFGVVNIFFIETKNTERNKINIERWQKIAVSAMKQSLQLYLPELHDLMKLEKFTSSITERYVAYCGNEFPRISMSELVKQCETLILIGPEGDFTEQEIKFLMTNNFKPLSLGQNRLRTETAGILTASKFYDV